VMINEVGPRAEPCITLAKMSAKSAQRLETWCNESAQ